MSGLANAIIESSLVNPKLHSHINIYFEHYKNKKIDKQVDCSVCKFLFRQKNEHLSKIATSLRLIKRISVRLPLTTEGLTLTWFMFKNIFEMSMEDALNIDPFSLQTHIVADMCFMDANSTQSIVGEYQATALQAQNISHSASKTDLDLLYAFQLLLNRNVNKGGCAGYMVDIHSRCLYSSKGELSLLQLNPHLITDARALVAPRWILKNGKQLKDFHDSNQLFTYQPGVQINHSPEEENSQSACSKNTICDHLKATVNSCNSSLSSWCARTLESLSNSEKNINNSAEPIDISNNAINMNVSNVATDCSAPSSATSTLLLALEKEGYVNAQNLTGEINENLQFYQQNHEQAARNLCKKLDTLYDIYLTVSPHNTGFLPTKTLLGDRKCMFCTLAVVPEFRAVLLDIIVLIKEKSQKLCLGGPVIFEQRMILADHADTSTFTYGKAAEIEDELKHKIQTKYTTKRKSRKNPISRKQNLQNAMKRTKNGAVSYTYNLDKSHINLACIESVFDEWAKLKYPFLLPWFTSHSIDRETVTSQLLTHLSCNHSLFCAINFRRLLTDTNEHISHGHTCSLPFMASIYQTLKAHGRDLHNHKESLLKLCAKHHMNPIL